MSWKNSTWCSFDTETTGVRNSDRIVEIGAVLWNASERREVERLQTFVDPMMPIPPEATEIHGIVDDDVVGSPTVPQVVGRLFDMMREAAVVVAFNWPFENRFFTNASDQWATNTSGMHIIDPLAILRMDHVGRWWGGKGRHRLSSACKRLGVEWRGDAHRAADDGVMTCLLLEKLLHYMPDDVVEASSMIKEHRVFERQRFNNWLGTKRIEDGEG